MHRGSVPDCGDMHTGAVRCRWSRSHGFGLWFRWVLASVAPVVLTGLATRPIYGRLTANWSRAFDEPGLGWIYVGFFLLAALLPASQALVLWSASAGSL